MQSSRLDELLRAERAVAPEPGADDRIWAAIEHRLSHGPPPPAGVEAAPAAAGGTLLLKVAAGVALVAAAAGAIAAGGGGGDEAVREDRIVAAAEPARTPSVAPREDAPREDAPKADAPTDAPKEDASTDAAPPAVVAEPPSVAPTIASKKSPSRPKKAAAKPSEPEPEPVASEPPPPVDFQAELGLIQEIRRALKLGNWTEGLELVDEHVRRFGARGQLVQERIAYEVLALCALKRKDQARRAADELLKEWPDSTHAPKVRCAYE